MRERSRVVDLAHDLSEDLIALRHDLHRHPELGNDLPRTQRAVLDALDGLDLEVTVGKSLSSVVAVLRGRAGTQGAGERPVVLLRGDMDGLPVTETTGALMYDSSEAKRVNAVIRGGSDVVVEWATRGPASTYTTGDNIHLTPKGVTLHAALMGDGVQQCLARPRPRSPVRAPTNGYRPPQHNA